MCLAGYLLSAYLMPMTPPDELSSMYADPFMGPFQEQSHPLYERVQCDMDNLHPLRPKHTLTMQVAMNALLLSETVYRIMDPGGPAEAERVADMLMEDLPAFARSSLHLQWSDHITQRCVMPPLHLRRSSLPAQRQDASYGGLMDNVGDVIADKCHP